MADSKLTALSAITSASTDDLMYVVDDPSGTPASKKITFANVMASLNKVGKITVTQPATGGTLTIDDGASIITSGGDAITLTTTADSNVTLPTSGTLSTLAGSEELTNKTLNASVGKGTWTASGTWTLPAFTTGGLVTLGNNILFGENTELLLDAALSADGKYCGITENGTAGTTLAFGDLVYLSVTDSRWELTDADADATCGAVRIGICVLAAAADGDATKILTYGKIRADANFPTFTVGAPVYASTTAGDVQVAQPSGTDDVIRIVGYGNTTDELFFCPSTEYMTHV